jgi:hypothetical protein
MTVGTETKMRELRILWVSRADGLLGMAWVYESFLVRRASGVGGWHG